MILIILIKRGGTCISMLAYTLPEDGTSVSKHVGVMCVTNGVTWSAFVRDTLIKINIMFTDVVYLLK